MTIESVVAFGKIIFIPTQESIPPLPEMNLLFLKEDSIYPWRSACIDLEIDAVGNSMDEAWDNLKDALTMYIDMERKAANNSIIETARRITQIAFTPSLQKSDYISLYRQAKLMYTMKSIESGKLFNPIEEEKLQIAKLEAIEEPIRRTTHILDKAA